MPNYKNLYYYICAAASSALDQIDEQNIGMAKNILITALSETEEKILARSEHKNSAD